MESQASDLAGRIVSELKKIIVGQDETIEMMVIALIARGHALLEGVPGTAKTLLARTLSYVTGMCFRRIQFTPDLMPSDVLGVNIYNTATGTFLFRPGPIFCDILLADEINRAPAKTQSALLEAMEERQVTRDEESHALSPAFTVFATQNPIEFEGTYPLPEAQLDRFMMKILVPYPPERDEFVILDKVEGGFDTSDLSTGGVETVLDCARLAALRQSARNLHAEPQVREYITRIVRATRSMPQASLGASPRTAVMLLQAAKANALLSGRTFVTPDDVKRVAPAVLRHRIILLPEVEVEGRSTDDCIGILLSQIEIPR